ncbi:MAG: NADP-dependent malic enzyme, partial [Candidatus Thermoplasmatota archaeon]|nr:NADP-dependent malic enzyme [Candidatus Thermoplasmatota archaeon]
MKKPTVKELLAKAEKPNKDAMKLHPFYHGKIEVVPKCVIRNFEDFGIWYTPGVAQPCRAIKENKNLVYDMTNKWNNVAVVSDGTRVLGLGDIGPEAGLPVMEGKALLFKYLGGVDAFPICLKTKDADEIIKTVKILQPSFGGINLEDISQPKCFRILETLRKECEIPVWHDDQQGTAAIILAGLINALKFVDKKMNEVKITMIGAGAANICAARMMIVAGVKPGNLIMVDSKGVLNQQRTELKENYKEKWEMCLKTNSEQKSGDAADAMKNADVCIAASKPGPGTIKPEWVKDMADDSIVFACANPVPEIWPWEAKEAGAKVFATGRSDFPNQVNNSLGFPGIFRGTLDVRAETITDEMCVEAAKALAECAEEKGLREDYIIPDMDDWEVFPKEATAVAMKAIEQGVARKKLGRNEEYENAKNIIKRARDTAAMLMEKGF